MEVCFRSDCVAKVFLRILARNIDSRLSEHATTIQKNRRTDSIVSNFITEPAPRLLQYNRSKSGSHLLTLSSSHFGPKPEVGFGKEGANPFPFCSWIFRFYSGPTCDHCSF